MNTYTQPIPPSEPFSLHGRQSSQTRPRRPLHMRENEATSSIPPIIVTESAIPNNTAIANVPVNTSNTNQQNGATNDRQMGFSTEDSILLDKFSKNVIKGFYIIEFVKFVFFFVIMMVTQVFDGSFNSCLIIFEVILGVYTILLIRHQFFCQTNQEKQINAYRIFQAILYILFVVFFQKSLAQDEGFEVQTSQNGQKINVPLIAITGVVLGNEVGKAIYIFSQSPRYKWRFAVRYNSLTLIRKLLLVAQVSAIVAVLITHTDELNQLTLSRSIWIYISIPLLLIGVTYAVQLFSLLRNYFTEAGKQLVSCLNPRNSLALLWITVLPIIWVGLIIWLVVDASDELPNYKVNAYDYYGDKHDPFLILFLVISVVSVVSVVITRSHQSYIMNIIRVLVTFYDTSLSGHQRMQAFLLELHKKEDARNFIPEFLIKISNDYFRLPTKPEIVLYEKIHKKKGILSRTKEEIQKEPAEIRLDADNEASEKDQEKAEKSIHYSLSDLEKNENQCVICFDNNPDAVYLPCGHGGACYECAQELARIKGECHLCRSPITRILKIAPIESLEDHVKVVLIMTTEKKETPNMAARRAVPTQIRLNVN